jgi:hypothetical protein
MLIGHPTSSSSNTGVLYKSPCLAPALVVTKVTNVKSLILVTLRYIRDVDCSRHISSLKNTNTTRVPVVGTNKGGRRADKAGQLGVNFTNILRAAFLYKSFLHSFYVLTIWVCNFLAKGFWRKSCS